MLELGVEHRQLPVELVERIEHIDKHNDIDKRDKILIGILEAVGAEISQRGHEHVCVVDARLFHNAAFAAHLDDAPDGVIEPVLAAALFEAGDLGKALHKIVVYGVDLRIAVADEDDTVAAGEDRGEVS